MPFMLVIKLGLVAMETTIYSSTSSDWDVWMCKWEREPKTCLFLFSYAFTLNTITHFWPRSVYVIIVSASTPLIALFEKHTETIKEKLRVSPCNKSWSQGKSTHKSPRLSYSLPTDLKNKCAEPPESPACAGECWKWPQFVSGEWHVCPLQIAE